MQTDSGGALCAEWGNPKSVEPPGQQPPNHDKRQLCVTRGSRMGCGTGNWCSRRALCWLWASSSTSGCETEHCAPTHTQLHSANGPLATPMPQGLGYPLVSVATGPAEGTGLSPLTNTDSSNDWGGDDRQGDPTSNGQVPLVLGGFLPLVPAVDLMEGKAPGENSRHPEDMNK